MVFLASVYTSAKKKFRVWNGVSSFIPRQEPVFISTK